MANNYCYVVKITDKISKHLGLRNVCDDFMDYIESLEADNITIDFEGVVTISRSFAHQYIIRKRKSKKIINEINLADNIKKMFDIVKESIDNPKPKRPIIDFSNVKVTYVNI